MWCVTSAWSMLFWQVVDSVADALAEGASAVEAQGQPLATAIVTEVGCAYTPRPALGSST